MSSASPDKPSVYSQSPTPGLNDVELEVAVLRSVVETRPVGQHKHILMIQLQAELQRRTGVWIPSVELWDKIGDIYDIPKLESLVDNPSLPSSPEVLSPLPHSRRHRQHSGSLSPLSSGSRSPSPVKKPSKSAQCINSDHFRTTFNLPYLRLGEDEWKQHLFDPVQAARDAAGPARRRSRSVASSSTRPATDDGALLGEAEPDLSEDEYGWWSEKLNDRAKEDDGDAAEKDTTTFHEGITKQIDEGDKARERQEAEESKTGKKKVGRPSKASKAAAAAAAARDGTSELSDEGEQEEEAPRTARGRRAATNGGNKRKRDSAAKEESEDENDTKDKKTRRKRR